MEIPSSEIQRIEKLRQHILTAEAQLNALRTQLQDLESKTGTLHSTVSSTNTHQVDSVVKPSTAWKWPLEEKEYLRYGRQLVLPAVGIEGQLRLKATAVLLVGAGGLGCPAAAYLAGAGLGTLGIVDGDTVEESNLHRQIAHSTDKVGKMKVDSLVEYCQRLNPGVCYVRHGTHLTSQNAEEIVSGYDVVLDCTDHPTSRYLISDICVLLRKPLVSASALRTDGQLIVLNNPALPQGSLQGGPCYRCVFPKPPPPDSVIGCGEGGILGPVVGVMGVLQALETIKLITAGIEKQQVDPPAPSLLLFSASGTTTFRSMRMRGRRANCFACSVSSTLTTGTLQSGSLDYVQFCGVTKPIRLLNPEERVSPTAYNNFLTELPSKEHLLLDVREQAHFAIASLPGAVNVPFSSIASPGSSQETLEPDWVPKNLSPDAPIYVICRVGNDSQVVTRQLKEMGLDQAGQRFIGDIEGGMRAWKQQVDSTIPFA